MAHSSKVFKSASSIQYPEPLVGVRGHYISLICANLRNLRISSPAIFVRVSLQPSKRRNGNTFIGDPVHSVWAYNNQNRWAVLITTYRPDPTRWIN